jgi:hypothetical protein
VKSFFIPPHQERLEKVEILSYIQQRLEEEVTETLLIQEKKLIDNFTPLCAGKKNIGD